MRAHWNPATGQRYVWRLRPGAVCLAVAVVVLTAAVVITFVIVH